MTHKGPDAVKWRTAKINRTHLLPIFGAILLVLSLPLMALGGSVGVASAYEITDGYYYEDWSQGDLTGYTTTEQLGMDGFTEIDVTSSTSAVGSNSLHMRAGSTAATSEVSSIEAVPNDTFQMGRSFTFGFQSEIDCATGNNKQVTGIELLSDSGKSMQMFYSCGSGNPDESWELSGDLLNGSISPDSMGGNVPWHAVTIEVDGTTETVTLSIDGQQEGSTELVDTFQGEDVEVYYRTQSQGDGDGTDYSIDAWYDDIELTVGDYSTGTVTDTQGNPIDNATVEVRETSTANTTTTTTDSDGDFNVEVDGGTYNIIISKVGYQTADVTRTIESGEDFGTFELEGSQLSLEFGRYLEPGETTPYTVEFTDENGTDVDVAGSVTMNSSNTGIATVDTDELVINGSEGVNGTSVITANYTVGNETYTDTRTVTVATKTVDNLEILPGTWRFSALLEDITIQVVLVAIGAAIVATRAASAWAGLGAMELVIIIGWFGGWVPIGIAMLGLFTALFIGLNLAANIDYSVRRS